MLVDEVVIRVNAGTGGNGAVSFKRNAQTAKGGPDGGNGGNGGNVYFQGINDITALSEFSYKKSVKAEDGVKGGKQNLFGRNGKDLIVKLPLGSVITNLKTKEVLEIKNETSKILIAMGGKGGKGNNEFKTATDQAPYYAEKGGIGDEKHLKIELKLIADIGLIGLPNAGKSSLLEVLTNAKPKIGNYAFTTLEPNLGVMQGGLILADIPGLIEGASSGKGLGDKFLKHIERTKVLIHCIDVNSDIPLKNYATVRNELQNYNEDLVTKNELIVLTKTDLIDSKSLLKLKKQFAKISSNVLNVSIYDELSLGKLKENIIQFLKG
jgi:GTP-binding protein